MSPLVKRLVLGGGLALGAVSCAGGWGYQEGVVEDPGPQFTREAIQAIIAQESPVYYRDGATRIGVFFDLEHRAYVPFAEIPKAYVNAIVAAEDGDFFEHKGVSPKHIVRAMWNNAKAGSVVAGGSTLTQQTAKNLFYRPDRSLRSKWGELVNALRLEAHFSKEDILEFYANQFHVSANGRGLGIAARYFFDKEVSELSVKECAFIAGLVKAPSRYNPFVGGTEERRQAAREAAEQRTAYVLRRMQEEGSLSAGERAALTAEPLVFRRGTFQYDRSVLLDEVQRRLEEPAFIELFERLEIDNPSTAGIQIITTVDATVQREATWGLWHHLTEIGPILEKTGASALRLSEKTPVPHDPDTALLVHGFYAARIASVSLDSLATGGLSLDVGGHPCQVDKQGVDRIASVLTRARTGNATAKADDTARAALVEALPVGTIVLTSVREEGICDLELRPRLQGAAVVLEDGQVRALVGGNDNRNFNRASSAQRQFGSTWKPLVYLAALQLGWLPTDALDNRRSVFPFRDVWYYPRPDHPSDAFVTMSMAGARSENLSSVWLLAHITDPLNAEQLRRLAGLVGLAKRADESDEAFRVRMRDDEGLRSSPERFEELAFTAARPDVLSGLAFGAHPEDAAKLRSLHHGHGFAAERARVLRTAASSERSARLAMLQDNFLALEEAVPGCLSDLGAIRRDPVSGALACGGAPEGWEPVVEPLEEGADFLVNGRLHRSTITELRAAVDRHVATFAGRDPWDPEVLASHPDYRTLVGIRYVTRMVAALGVDADLPDVLSLPLGAADLTLTDAAALYQGMLRGERWSFVGQGYDEGAVPGLRTTFDLPAAPPAAALVAEIRDAAGNVLYRARPKAERVIDARSGELTGDILRNVVRVGTGRRAADAVRVNDLAVPLAGKTGTTNDYRNAAFLGFAPRARDGRYTWGDGYTVAAYVGYDDNTSMRRGGWKVQGANGALPVWLATVRGLEKAGMLGGAGGTEYLPSEGLVRMPVAAGTGLARADGAEGATTLVSAGSARRFAPFTESPAVADAVAGGSTPPPVADGPGLDLLPGDLEEGTEAVTGNATEKSVWDGL
ncbi:MAG: transglycosylase domain-containing protein [Pseudomonadota bacterium]|nr:transglycosylase domain-containing protein [Pseudomonadota bacterium]